MKETKERKEMKGGAAAFIRRNIAAITAPAVIMLASVNSAMAIDAKSVTANMKTQLSGWLTALGFLIAVMGAAQWGWGYLRDDPENKARGWKMIVGGAIVAAAINIAEAIGFGV